MKKISFCLVGLFLSLLFAGCEKEPKEEPVIPGSKPSIQITVSPSDSVELNGSASLSYHTSNGDSATINGVSAPLSGCINIILKKDTTFSFNVKNKFGQTTEVRNIFVKKEVVNNPLPTMVLSVSPSTALPVGGGVATISWSAENTDIVYYNNVGHGSTGSVLTEWIRKDTILSLMAVGPGGNRTFFKSINVEQPPPPLSVMQLLVLDEWKNIKEEEKFTTIDSTQWVFVDINFSCLQDDRITFTANPQKMIEDFGFEFCDGQTSRFHYFNFTLNGMVISGFGDKTIVSINSDTLVWVENSIHLNLNPDGSITVLPVILRKTFIHP